MKSLSFLCLSAGSQGRYRFHAQSAPFYVQASRAFHSALTGKTCMRDTINLTTSARKMFKGKWNTLAKCERNIVYFFSVLLALAVVNPSAF